MDFISNTLQFLIQTIYIHQCYLHFRCQKVCAVFWVQMCLWVLKAAALNTSSRSCCACSSVWLLSNGSGASLSSCSPASLIIMRLSHIWDLTYSREFCCETKEQTWWWEPSSGKTRALQSRCLNHSSMLACSNHWVKVQRVQSSLPSYY